MLIFSLCVIINVGCLWLKNAYNINRKYFSYFKYLTTSMRSNVLYGCERLTLDYNTEKSPCILNIYIDAC